MCCVLCVVCCVLCAVFGGFGESMPQMKELKPRGSRIHSKKHQNGTHERFGTDLLAPVGVPESNRSQGEKISGARRLISKRFVTPLDFERGQRRRRRRRDGQTIYIVPSIRIRHWDQYSNVPSVPTTGRRFRTPTVKPLHIDSSRGENRSF